MYDMLEKNILCLKVIFVLFAFIMNNTLDIVVDVPFWNHYNRSALYLSV